MKGRQSLLHDRSMVQQLPGQDRIDASSAEQSCGETQRARQETPGRSSECEKGNVPCWMRVEVGEMRLDYQGQRMESDAMNSNTREVIVGVRSGIDSRTAR